MSPCMDEDDWAVEALGECQARLAAQAEQIGALKAVVRLVHEREWPAGDKTKAAKHAAEMWAIADEARHKGNF